MEYKQIIFSFLALFSAFVNESYAQKAFTVVLDAGHGGKDSGAVGRKAKEKDIVLDVTLRLGKMIGDSLASVNTVYTRDQDVFVPLNQRAEIANKIKANLFISIHANASKSKDVTGTETFTLGLHRTQDNLEIAKKENSVIAFEDGYENKYEGFDPSDTESYVIFELMQNRFLDQSNEVARLVQDAFVDVKRGDRSVKQAGFLVLRQTTMPSILIELGFISNAEEEAYMMSDEGKNELVASIFKAFKRYKLLYDERSKVSFGRHEEEPVKVEEPVDPIISYGIQIASTSTKLESLPTEYGEVKVYEEGGLFKYVVGSSTNYDEIKSLDKKVKKAYKDSFIVAFEGNKRVVVRYAVNKQKQQKQK